MSLEENVNENVKPEISAEKKEENGNGENREEGAKPARRPQYRRPRRGQRAPKAVKVEEKEETENAGAAEPKTEERRKPAQARGRQQGNRRSLPAVKEAGERKAPVRKPSRNNQKEAKSKLKIIPLGGLEQIGMNITAFEYEDSIIVVDCGLAFPGDDMLGIDLVIPDVSYLKQNIDKVKGFVITHGHEDHIGALPYILQQVNVPIYGTKLTIALIEHKLKEHNLLKTTKRKVMKHGQSVNLGCFRVEFIKTNHSIQDALPPLQSSHRLVLFFIQVTLRSTTHLFLVILLICSVLQSWVKKVFLLCWQTVPMLPDLDLPCLSAA